MIWNSTWIVIVVAEVPWVIEPYLMAYPLYVISIVIGIAGYAIIKDVLGNTNVCPPTTHPSLDKGFITARR